MFPFHPEHSSHSLYLPYVFLICVQHLHPAFYRVDTAYFVDLPGYGYAKVSNADRERWDELINSYFEADRALNVLVQLLDSRHAPSADDVQMMEYLHFHRIPFVVALTKAEKLKKSEMPAQLEEFRITCAPYGCKQVFLTSAE